MLAVLWATGLLACTQNSSPTDPSGGAWSAFGGTAGGAVLPSGWAVEDPFTSKTRHWLGHTVVGPGPSTIWADSDLALIRSPVALESQAYLLRGPAEVWRPRLEKGFDHLDHPLVTVADRGTIVTADGTELRYLVASIEEGIVAGDRLSYFLAYGHVGEDLLIIDAGGPTGLFDPRDLRRFVETLAPADASARTVLVEGSLPAAPTAVGRTSPLREEEDHLADVQAQVMRFLPPAGRAN